VITKSTVKAIVAGGGVIATWFAVGPTHSTPASPARAAVHSTAIQEATADQLNAQANKLRDQIGSARLRPATRNPFRFGSPKPYAGRVPTDRAQVSTIAADAPVVLPPPAYALSGVGERATAEGLKRTAVISGNGQLYLVTEGEMVGGRYTVVRVDPEAVLLRDSSGTELTLVLK
jgi:hypothetical protein